MQFAISGQHLDITPAIREYVFTRFKKVERHLPRAHHANIVLHQEPHESWVEATLPVNGRVLHVNAKGHDLYAAIDKVAQKIDKRARRWTQRKRGRRHQVDDIVSKGID